MNLPTYITGSTQTKAYRVLREHVRSVLREYELTPTHWSMLGIILQAKTGVRPVDIANSLHVKAPLVTAMAQSLEERGLVKSVQNQFDARAKLLAVTPRGKRFVKNVDTALSELLGQLLKGLTESELTAYRKVLTTIISNDAVLKQHG